MGLPEQQHSGLFPPTHWSVVAGTGEDSARALEHLARAYWRPLYIFLRQRGRGHEQAADQVQGFFAAMLERDFLARVRQGAGRFRSYLLASFQNWLSDELSHAHRQKRGGGIADFSLDALAEDGGYPEPTTGHDACEAYDRQWALEVVERALAGLRAAYSARGRGETFDALRGALPGGPSEVDYPQIAARLGSSEATVRKAVFDLRSRFAEFVRAEIARTVETEAGVEEELRHLVRLLRK